MRKFSHVDKALNRPSPSRIPLSTPRCLENDFFVVYISFPETQWKFLCTSKEHNAYSGILWIAEEAGHEATLLRAAIEDLRTTVEITHYYKCYEFIYTSKWSFFLAQLSARHKFHVAKEKIAQGVFNRKTLVRSERMEVLNYLVERTIEEPGFSTSSITLGAQLNSPRWLHHPQQPQHQSYYRLLLDSLVATGDLAANTGSYTVTGQALSTLSEYEREQQKHQDNFNNAKMTNRLTLGLIFIGVLGVLAQLYMWLKGDP